MLAIFILFFLTVSVGPVAAGAFSYTLDDRPYTATLGAGAANVQEQRQYDDNDRLLCSQTGGPTVSGRLLALSYAYAYSPLGVTTAISAYNATTCGGAPPSAQALGYDAHGRLVSASGVAWGYDGNGNLTSVARAPAVAGAQPISQTYYYTNPDGSPPVGGLPNELVSVRYGSQPTGALAAGYGYDAAGNTTVITTVNATANTTTLRALTYDAQGHLTNVASSDGVSVTVGYNARGLRATITVSDAHPNTGPTASFVERLTYRGNRVGQVAVLEGTASFTETFLYRPDGEPLELLYQNPSQGQPRPTPYWYVTNGRGDVVALTDNRGAVVDQYRYDPWGVLTSGGGTGVALAVEGVPQPLRYRGYWYEGWYDGAGLFNSGSYGSNDDRPLLWYALTNRTYDPSLERFLQPDPSSQDGVRSYTYCHNAPIDCADPSGLAGQGIGPEPPIEPPVGPTIGEGAANGNASSAAPLGLGTEDLVTTPEVGAPIVDMAMGLGEPAATTAAAFAELAQMRIDDGIQPPSTGKPGGDEYTRSKLEIGDKAYFGRNAHGRPLPEGLVYNNQTIYHAEGDSFIQAYNDGATAESGRLYVDQPLCKSCGLRGGVKSLARQLGLLRLEIYTLDGNVRIEYPQMHWREVAKLRRQGLLE